MTGETDLSGRYVLVVEDEYYIATDMAHALQRAGAIVLGPCRSEIDALTQLAEQRPDAVVLDINLGQGASFKLAEHLNHSGIPFVFVTGYDNGTIPEKFRDFERLTKPLELCHIPRAISRVVAGKGGAVAMI